MARLVVLDSGPLGMASKPATKPDAARARSVLDRLAAAGARIIIPEISDYEVRRELLRIGNSAGIARLDRLRDFFTYDPITPPAMRLAAEFWAMARRQGRPTTHPHALDGDVILAAQATLMAGPGDSVTVTTTNLGHLSQFVDARDWATIA